MEARHDAGGQVERGPGLRFLEVWSTFVGRTWQHERTVVATDQGCRLADRVSLEPRAAVGRVAGSAVMVRRVVEAIFDHRHRRLAARFG